MFASFSFRRTSDFDEGIEMKTFCIGVSIDSELSKISELHIRSKFSLISTRKILIIGPLIENNIILCENPISTLISINLKLKVNKFVNSVYKQHVYRLDDRLHFNILKSHHVIHKLIFNKFFRYYNGTPLSSNENIIDTLQVYMISPKVKFKNIHMILLKLK